MDMRNHKPKEVMDVPFYDRTIGKAFSFKRKIPIKSDSTSEWTYYGVKNKKSVYGQIHLAAKVKDDYETSSFSPILQRYRNSKDESQKDYIRACKHCGVVPLTVFLRQLGEKSMSLRFQLLSQKAIKSCAIALLRNSKLQSLDLEGCQIRPSGAKYMFDVLEKRTNITEIVGYKFIARSECI
uniref:Uncharacterized protein n=1 Tax=Magallana gigas TaxID=29159 RepID=K1PZ02_MAGGI